MDRNDEKPSRISSYYNFYIRHYTHLNHWFFSLAFIKYSLSCTVCYDVFSNKEKMIKCTPPQKKILFLKPPLARKNASLRFPRSLFWSKMVKECHSLTCILNAYWLITTSDCAIKCIPIIYVLFILKQFISDKVTG